MSSQKLRSRAAGVINIVFTMMLSLSMIAALAVPQEVEAATPDKLPNSIALDRLLTDRSFVVDALTVGTRKPKDWGGEAFSENPHLYTGPDHFMYEQLIEESENNDALSAPLALYSAKVDWEEYPLETLMSAVESTAWYLILIKQFNTMANDAAVSALKQAYEDYGGKYPVNAALENLRAEAASEDYADFWKDYSFAELETLEGKEGTDIYEAFKERMDASDSACDKRLLSILKDAETECANLKENDSNIKITQRLLNIVQSKISFEHNVNGETRKSAKIYDAILSDLFQTEYTSGANVSLGMDLETKEAFEMYTDICKNEGEILGFASDALGLGSDSTRIMLDDYLEPLMNYSKSKTENLNGAFDVMTAQDSWFDEGMSVPSQGSLVNHWGFPTANERLQATKEAVEEKYMLHDSTIKAMDCIKKGLDLSKATLANYQLVDCMVRENESIREILLRTADQSDDPAYKSAAAAYRKLLDITLTTSSDTSIEVLTGVMRTAIEQADKYLEKKVAKRTMSEARKAFISRGTDPISRAKIASKLSSVAWVYQTCDFLDDYVAGYQDVAERVYEVEYLSQIQNYAVAAYEQDVKLYKAAGNKYQANEYAGNALEELQFLKQIKLCQIEAGYKALSGFTNDTLAGIIAKLLEGCGATNLEAEYKQEMDAITNMMIFPGSNTPYIVPSGKTMTIKKLAYGKNAGGTDGKFTYVGIYDDGSRIAEVDLAVSQGIEIQGNVIVDCDFVLPTIIGSGGTLKIEDGRKVVLGYLDGVLGAESDLHFSGNVNGAVVPNAGAGKIDVTVDHDMQCDEYLGDAVEGDQFTVTVNGDLVVEKSMQLVNTNMTVKGNAKICTDEEDKAGMMNLINSTLTVEKDFTYTGRGYSQYAAYKYGLTDHSRLVLKGVSSFDTSDKEQYSMVYGTGTDSDSYIVLAGDGTAKLINNIYPDQEVPQPIGLPTIETKYSIEVLTARDTGLQNVRFDTDSIAGFENLEGIVNFPENIEVTEDSTVHNATLNCSGAMVFDKDLSVTSHARMHTAAHIKGDLDSNGTTEIYKQVTVDGKTTVSGLLSATTSIDSTPVLLKSKVIINEGGQLQADLESVDSSLPYTSDQITEWQNNTFALTIDGDVLNKREGTIKAESLMITGALTTEGYDDATGKNSYTDIDRLHIRGYLDCKGNKRLGLGSSGISDLTIEDGADLTGLSTSGLYTVNKLTVLGDKNKVHEIITNANVHVRYMYTGDCKVSLPNGLIFQDLHVDGTMTVEGPVPEFRGWTSYTGEVVFEDTVKYFSMYNEDRTTHETPPPNNIFNKIHAKKDLYVYGNFNVNEPKVETDTAAGEIKVDGDLVFGTGAEAVIYGKSEDFGNANIVVGKDAKVIFHADEVTARGLHLQYPESMFRIDAPLTENALRHLTLNGGDYVVNDNETLVNWLTLNSDEPRTISGGEAAFGKLEANVPELTVASDKLDIWDFQTDTENILIKGTFKYVDLRIPSDEVCRKAGRIRFEDVYGLNEQSVGVGDDRIANFAWDISSIEAAENGYKYTGDLVLTDTDDAYRVTVGCANENEELRYTYLYKSGSLLLPYRADGKLMDHLYTDKECYNQIDVTKTNVDGDMDLYYRGPGLASIPEDPEVIYVDEEKEVTPSKLYETKTYKFTPETDGLYGFESQSNELWMRGCIVVDDGKYYSENYTYNTTDFGEQFIARAGETYYLQSNIDYGEVGSYTVKVTRLGDIPDPDDPGPGPGPEPDVDPTLNVIPIEDIESVELLHDRPYMLSIENMVDEYCTFTTGIDYLLRRGDRFVFHMKDGSSKTYTYSSFSIDESSSMTCLNDGTNWINLWEESVVETDENGEPVLWKEGEDHQWYVTYSMTPWAARYNYSEYADNITCLVDVHVASAEEIELSEAKDRAIDDVDYYITGDYEGALDDYADEQKAEINKLAEDTKAAIEQAVSAEEADRIVQEAIAAKDKIYKSYQLEQLALTAEDAKGNLSNFKDEELLEQYSPAARKQILDLIAETERQIDEVMASRDDYPDFDSFYNYYSIAVWDLSNECIERINDEFEMTEQVDVELKLSDDRFTYNGKVRKPTVTVLVDGDELDASEYEIAWDTDCKNVGEHSVSVILTGEFRGSATEYFYIDKGPNTMTVKGKTATVKFKSLKKKTQTIKVGKAFAVSNAAGKVTYKVAKYDKKAKKKITVNSAGKVTVKKGLKKGKYKLTVKVTAAGNSNCYKATKSVVLTVRVK